MATAALAARDLFFISKATNAAQAAGLTLRVVGQMAAIPDDTMLALVDLALKPDAEALADLRRRLPDAKLIAFGPHVEAEALRAARAAGFDLALPHSEFAKRLPELLQA